MKYSSLPIAFALATLVLVIFVPENVDAQIACADEGTCLGSAFLQICNQSTGCGGLGGTRDFCLTTRADCSIEDGSTWELDPGASIQVFYRTQTSGVPPETPNNVVLDVMFDDTSSLVTRLHLGAEPANGASFDFFATDDGMAGGVDRAGTYRLKITVERTSIGTYEGNSDGTGAGTDAEQWAKGAIRSRMDVSSLTASSPPAGTHFAYGTAADESVTLTATHTQPNVDADVETARWRTRDAPAGTVRDTQSTTDIDATTSTAFASVIDLTYPEVLGTYDGDWDLIGDAVLTGRTWTNFTSGSIGRVSDTTVRLSDAFDADPSIIFSSDGVVRDNEVNTSFGVYNRGELVTYDFFLLNSRDEQLTRSMTTEVRSSDTTLVDSQSKTGANYAGTYTPDPTDPAVKNEVGDLHFFRVTSTEQTKDSDSSHGISSLYFVDSHPQTTSTLNKDDFNVVGEDDTAENHQYIIGADVLNTWCHVKGVRKDVEIDTGDDQVTISLFDPDGVFFSSILTQTGADGWSIQQLVEAAVSPQGTWDTTCVVAFQGNSGEDGELIGFLSSFTENSYCRIIFTTDLTTNTPERVFCLVQKNEQNFTPDEVPVIDIMRVDEAGNTERVVNTQEMFNAANHTQTVNGSLYYYNFTITSDDGTSINTVVLTRIDGAVNRDQSANSVPGVGEDILTTGLELGTTSSLNVLVILVMVFLGIMLWSRSGDFLVELSGAFLVLIAALVTLSFIGHWEPMIFVTTLTFLLGLWMLLKSFLEVIIDKKQVSL